MGLPHLWTLLGLQFDMPKYDFLDAVNSKTGVLSLT